MRLPFFIVCVVIYVCVVVLAALGGSGGFGFFGVFCFWFFFLVPGPSLALALRWASWPCLSGARVLFRFFAFRSVWCLVLVSLSPPVWGLVFAFINVVPNLAFLLACCFFLAVVLAAVFRTAS